MDKLQLWKTFENDFFEKGENVNRCRVASTYIPDTADSVIDFGAGKMKLKNFLPVGVKYYPVDYISRCPETIVFDFNKDEFPDQHAEYAVVCGCLEWCDKPKEFFAKLSSKYEKIIMSYLPIEFTSYINQNLNRLSYYELLKMIYDNKMYIHSSSRMFFRSAVGINDIMLLLKKQYDEFAKEDYFHGELTNLSNDKWACVEKKISISNEYKSDFIRFLTERFGDMSIIQMKNLLINCFNQFEQFIENGRLLQNGELIANFQIKSCVVRYLQTNDIVVYGCGLHGKQLLRVLQSYGIVPLMVVDKVVREVVIENVFYDVYPPDILTEMRDIKIVITPENNLDIISILKTYGFERKDYRVLGEIIQF